MFRGMLLGMILLTGVVYAMDSMADANQKPIVNWDVAADEWANMQHNVRVAWDRLTGSIERART